MTEITSASHGFFGVSAARYRRTKYVRVIAVIVAPFKFSDVQRQVLAADFMEAAHDATFQQRPKAIDRLSMNSAVDILTSAMPNGPVLFQLAISGIVIGCDQANFFRNRFADEAVQCFGISMFDDARDHIALAFDGTYNSVLAFSAGSWCALIPMPVFVLPADVRFVNFNDTHELTELRFS